MATQEGFDDWLAKGLGRAVIHLSNSGGAPHRDSVLNACIHDLAYDRQCEGGREEYLKDLIRASGEDQFIRDGIFRALSADHLEADRVDLTQIVAVSRMFADRGDSVLKRSMYEAVRRIGFSHGQDCLVELVAMDGIEALEFALGQFPESLGAFELSTLDSLLSTLETRDGVAEARKAISEASSLSPIWEILAGRIGIDDSRPPFVDETSGLDYRTLKSKIQLDTKFRPLARWGQSATEDDLKAASNDLIAERDRNRLLTYLSIFRKAPFPGPIDRLLELVEDTDGRLAQGATQILARINDPRIRALALKRIERGYSCGDAIELLTNNLHKDDFARIELLLLQKVDDRDSIHAIGMGLRHLVKSHCVPESTTCLIHTYEHGPCSLCRGETVAFLIRLNALPDWMREECKFDADLETRKLVSA